MCNEFFNNIRCKGGLLRRHAWLGFGILATIYCVELSSGVEKYFNSIFLPSL
jgi:hypothetical protein